MSPGPQDGQFFVTGGTMDPDSASYIVRRADTELFEALRNGELCYVLASRQMGKSSLMARTARRLASEDVKTAIVDLTTFSEKRGVADDWYYAVVDHIADKLGLQFDTGSWWRENGNLPPLGRMTRFLDRVVLAGCPGQVVIFVDEIDSTISLPFSDDFFAAIRACYNAGAVESRFKRLNFVLLGVATPAQLIRDTTRTPFNVGRGVELTDFTVEEAAPLAAGLNTDSQRAADLLRRVLEWTDGHPYLTQTLCWYLVRNPTWELDELVKDVFLSKRAAREEPNLRLVRERLTQGGADLTSVLELYREIVEGQAVRDEPSSPVHASLRLSGVVKTDSSGELKVRNRVYQKVFSAEWVASELPAKAPEGPAVPVELQEAYAAYDVLRRLPEFRSKAGGVLARICETRGMRDEALLIRIRDLQEDHAVASRRFAENLIDYDYRDLLLSFVHGGPVTCAALGPGGTGVLTGSKDGTARIWSAVSGEPLLAPFRHRAPVTAVAFSPDGKCCATGSEDYTACIWDKETGRRTGPLRHQARVRWVAFSADGSKFLTTSADGTAGIWDAVSGEPVCMQLHHPDSIRMGAFSPDASYVVTVSQDRTAVLWPLALGGRHGSALLHDGGVNVVAFHPSGETFATAGEDGNVRVWETKSGALIRVFAHGAPVLDLAISPEGTYLASAGEDHLSKLWSWDSPESPCGILQHGDSVLTVVFTPDSRGILTGSADRAMRLWRVADGKHTGGPYRHYGKVTAVSCTPDGLKALTADQDGAARLWRLPSEGGGLPQTSAPSRAKAARQESPAVRVTQACSITDAAFSAAGNQIAACGSDGSVRIWETGCESPAYTLRHPAAALAVAFHPEGKQIATGCEDGSVRLWNSESGRAVEAPYAHDAAVRVLRFSPDGARLISGGDDRTARTWEIASQTAGEVFKHRGGVRAVAFRHDGMGLLTGSADRSAYLWIPGADEPLIFDHSSPVTAVAFQPLATEPVLTAAGKAAYLWRIARDGEEPRPVIAFTLPFGDPVAYAGFAPGGRRLLVITQWWSYYYDLTAAGPVMISSRLLPGRWTGAMRWLGDHAAVQLGLLETASSLWIGSKTFDLLDVAPLSGEPETLLSEWQHRLGLQITPENRLLPAFGF